jgi:osmotically-inducible protein OsmY
MRHSIPFFLSAAALASLAVFPACQGHEPDRSARPSPAVAVVPPAAPSQTEAPKAAAPIPDAKLAAAIEGAIAGDPMLHAQAVHLSVVGGEVTLRGTVSTLAAERRAGQLVAAFKGATSLIDALVAGGPARPDQEIAKAANAAIKRDPATRRSNVLATATAGTVTLRGTVDSAAQRELLVEDVSRVPGVRAVNLALASATSHRGDAEIAADVADRFRDDARLDGTKVAVVMRNGSAFASGVVGSIAQWNAAVDDAWVSGVNDVDAHAVRIDWRENEQARAAAAEPLPPDAHIADIVRRMLSDDPRVGAQVPTVRVGNGVATLSGSVLDFRAGRAAAGDANGVRGVWRVDDRMTVAPAVRESDAAIEDEVQQTLYNDPMTPDARNLQMTTLGAKVTLSGVVASPEEKTVIEGDVEEVPGVVAVENDLRVKGYDSATHALPLGSMGDRVREGIFWDPRIGGGEVTTAATPNGDLTLTGLVFAWSEARAAGEDALRAGAAHVDNRIRLAGAPGFSPPPESGR